VASGRDHRLRAEAPGENLIQVRCRHVDEDHLFA
jgi:hypothetical protein